MWEPAWMQNMICAVQTETRAVLHLLTWASSHNTTVFCVCQKQTLFGSAGWPRDSTTKQLVIMWSDFLSHNGNTKKEHRGKPAIPPGLVQSPKIRKCEVSTSQSETGRVHMVGHELRNSRSRHEERALSGAIDNLQTPKGTRFTTVPLKPPVLLHTHYSHRK